MVENSPWLVILVSAEHLVNLPLWGTFVEYGSRCARPHTSVNRPVDLRRGLDLEKKV